jgi:CRISPR-associated protein (TIGR02584 family)
MTPQVITETLYVLMVEEGKRVDEIRVITTLDGRDKIMTGISNGRGRAEESLLHPQAGQFYAFCRDFHVDPRSIRFDEKSIALLHTRDGLTLPDIRTPEENELAGDTICDIVRELAKNDDSRIHASAAGGRKTMSIYLTAAMQLFGRVQDTLSHVLVNEDFEGNTAFYYPPPEPITIKTRDGREVSTADARIYLAPIPFIRLQGARSEWLREGGRSYGDFVRQAQEYLDLAESAHDVKIHLRDKTITVANIDVGTLTEKQFFIYALFAYLKQENRGQAGFVSLGEIRREDLNTILRRVTAAAGEEQSLDDYESSRFDFVRTLASQVESHLPKDQDDLNTSVIEAVSKIKREFKKADLPEEYIIARRGRRGAARYGLKVNPDHIFWL